MWQFTLKLQAICFQYIVLYIKIKLETQQESFHT